MLFGVDPAGSGGDVVVVERRGGRWVVLHPEPEPVVPALHPEPPRVMRWRETICWRDTVKGWIQEHREGEFVLDEAQRHMVEETYARLVAEGKLFHSSTAQEVRS